LHYTLAGVWWIWWFQPYCFPFRITRLLSPSRFSQPHVVSLLLTSYNACFLPYSSSWVSHLLLFKLSPHFGQYVSMKYGEEVGPSLEFDHISSIQPMSRIFLVDIINSNIGLMTWITFISEPYYSLSRNDSLTLVRIA
jgi:hypothetical protein